MRDMVKIEPGSYIGGRIW